jgi:hypothetical protein
VNAPSSLSSNSIEVTFEEVQEALDRVRRHKRWPVFACALVATFAATFAFTSSPLGVHKSVKPTLDVASQHVVAATDRVMAETRQLIGRLR